MVTIRPDAELARVTVDVVEESKLPMHLVSDIYDAAHTLITVKDKKNAELVAFHIDCGDCGGQFVISSIDGVCIKDEPCEKGCKAIQDYWLHCLKRAKNSLNDSRKSY